MVNSQQLQLDPCQNVNTEQGENLAAVEYMQDVNIKSMQGENLAAVESMQNVNTETEEFIIYTGRRPCRFYRCL